MVDAFVKGLRASLNSDSLIRHRAESMEKIRERGAVHIEEKEIMRRKRNNEL